MAETEPPAPAPAPPVPPPRPWTAALLRLTAMVGLVLIGFGALALLVLDSPLGHRLVTDRIAALKLESGLVITIGRIDGSLLGTSSLHNVVLSDASGRFMTVPDVALAWRPLPALRLVMGLGGGLDIRDLTLKRGVLLRAPHLNPSDPNAPILPDFDIRLDRFRIDGLTIAAGKGGAPGLVGAKRRIDLTAKADVRHGRVVLSCYGRLGGRDRLSLHLDSEPDRDLFALDLDYRAPRDGLLAGLTAGATGGVRHGIMAQVGGAGRFSRWHGWVLAEADGHRLAGGLVDNTAGQYRLTALVHPGAVVGGLPADLAARPLAVTYAGTFAASRLDGRYHLADALGRIDGQGAIDLANNRAVALALTLRLLHPELLPEKWRTAVQPGAAVMTAQLDGPFADLAIRHDLALTQLAVGTTRLDGLHTAGVAHWHKGRLDLPLAASVARVNTGTAWLDPRLAGARLSGTLSFDGHTLSGDGLHVVGNGMGGNLSLKGDVGHGNYALAGQLTTHGLAVPRVGTIDGTGKGVLVLAQGRPWTLAVNYAANAAHFAIGGLNGVVGPSAHVTGSAHWGGAVPLILPDMRITSPSVTMTVKASYAQNGHIEVTTQGQHATYGAFDVHALIDHGATHAEAHFAEPLPSAGVKAVKVSLASTSGGYHLDLTGDSRLGPVAAALDFAVPANAGPNTGAHDPIKMTLTDAHVFDTNLTGTLAFDPAGLDGDLLVTGGGLDGTIHFAGHTGGAGVAGQGIDAAINAHAAKFGGTSPISIAVAKLNASALIAPDNTTINSALQAQGVAVDGLFIGRLIADATVVNGSGSVTASLAGRRGTRFALQGTAAFAPDRVIAFVAGDYAGNAITMPRRAILTREGEGWRLEPSQINFGSGAIIASGRIGAGTATSNATDLHLAISRMPLSALDIIYADLGLGGYISGVVDFRNDHSGAPAGHAALSVKGLSRSGLVLTSRPLDLALVAQLDERAFQVRAVAREGAVPRMRLQAVIADLPRGGTMIERVRGGRLNGQLRYAGPADALWRLAAIDAFDLTGPVGVAAQVSGTLDNPVLTGAVVSHAMRAQSAISGSDVQNIDLVGSFNGAHLSLAHFTGTTAGSGKNAGGKIAGSGTIDFSDASSQRPKIDFRLGATNAELVNRPEMGATITGPVRIVSDGTGGTIAGRLRIDRARYVLGKTTTAQALPTIAVTERNAPADLAPPVAHGPPWKLLIDASGANRIDVHGMGLESEWQTDVRIRGDTTTPQIFGSADVIRGSYEFSGKRFDLTRGRIRFNGETPIDPQLDIVATGDANDISATISIGGAASHPQITFASTPSLPEEELLSRILFGSSISQISAPEAVQLASALAALRGGGGLDPINKLRGAIGLDRLRVLSADPTIGRGTAVAVGKYLGRKFYIELVTDGHGYSATSIEFRLTRWLSLLGTISTVYDESLSLKYMKDY